MILFVVLTIVALVLLGMGLWREDLVIWVLGTIIWFIWTYITVNYAIAIGSTSNTFIPEAVGLMGVGFVFLCVYKDFSVTLQLLRNRKHPLSYDEEKLQQQNHIYNITRRKPRW